MDKNGVLWLIIHMSEILHYTISKKVSDIFDLYTELHGVRISLFSPDGRLLYPDAVGRPNCMHCIMLRDTMEMDEMCRLLDRKMMHSALEENRMITYTCHAGMREATAPLMVENELAGFVMIGQFRSEAAPETSPYAGSWNVLQQNDELQEEYEKTPIFPEHKIEILLSMFRHLLELIIGGQMIFHKDFDLLDPVIEFIRENPGQELSLREAAKMVGRSPSTVSRVFKKLTGHSFKQYQRNYRMELAATLLETKPNRPISEIARDVGCDDPLYFSRIFRSHHGLAPSHFRQNLPSKIQ